MKPSAPDGPIFKRVGQYDLFNFIGHGSFANVYRGQHRGTKHVVAVKAIQRARLNPKLQENLEGEISILQSLQHPNVVRLTDVQTTERHVYLMLEFCPGGDLMKLIRSKGAQSEAQTLQYLAQLAHGLRHLRQRNLIHRDLKPQNLLLSSSAPDALLKIADFGFARYMMQQDMAETLCGSPLYMAPEILRFQKYDAKADLWSVGTIVYELLTAHPPFTGANHVQLLKNIESREPRLPTHVSAECLSLLSGLLRHDPMQRLSFEEFFSHPFLSAALHSHTLSPPSPSASAASLPPSSPALTSAGPSVHRAQSAPVPPVEPPLLSPPSGEADPPPSASPPPDPPPPQAERLELPPAFPHAERIELPPASAPPPRAPRPACAPGRASPHASPQLSPSPPLPPSHSPHSPHSPSLASHRLSPTPSSPAGPRASPPPSNLTLSPPAPLSRAAPSSRPQPLLRRRGSSNADEMAAFAPSPQPGASSHHSSPDHTSAGSPPLAPPPDFQLVPAMPLPASHHLPHLLHPSASLASPTAYRLHPPRPAGPSIFPLVPLLAHADDGRPFACTALAPAGAPAAAPPRQVLPVSLPSAAEGAAPRGGGGGGALYDRSLDGIDAEYVLVSARHTSPALQRHHASPAEAHDTSPPAAPPPHEASSSAPPHREHELSLFSDLLQRSDALADLAEMSAQGGGTLGKFSTVEALALHVKALDVMHTALSAAQQLESLSADAAAHAEALRARFVQLLKSAERVRGLLAADGMGSSLSAAASRETVCVEELLYRHALNTGREAAVDELLGKLDASYTLYRRAKFLLLQLAQEPLVGPADRAVLNKYAAGFAWRLVEISQKQRQSTQHQPED